MDNTDMTSLHFVLTPFMAQGHLIPMVDIAKLMAQRGVTITIITTPHYIPKLQNIINRNANNSDLPINLAHVKFPFQEVGLSEDKENLELLSSYEEWKLHFKALNLLEKSVQKLMEAMVPPPSCIISDQFLHYTTDLAKTLKIPRVIFDGLSCFRILCMHVVRNSGILNTVVEEEYFVVPDFPHKVEFTLPQVDCKEDKMDIWSPHSSYGVIVNTFQELEPAYVDECKKIKGGKIWSIGPLPLWSNVGKEQGERERGNSGSIDQDKCLAWLDSQSPSSVLYVCFGTLADVSLAQLIEIALGLEESNRPFIWVIRAKGQKELETWMSESGFEERVGERGFIIKGWAPQALILPHGSVGGFLTHCGWNSVLEGITAGVPLLTWPFFGDQFCNEKLVVEILKVGVGLGVESPLNLKTGPVGVVVDKDRLKRGVDEVMGDRDEAEERRRRSKGFRELARKAVEEGGSSHSNVTSLIQDIAHQVQSKC